MNKKTITENLNNQIGVIKKQVRAIDAKIQKESNQAVIAALTVEKDELIIQCGEYQTELDELVNEEKKEAKTTLLDYIKQNDIAYLADEGKYVFVKNISTSPAMINLQEKVIDPSRIVGTLNKLMNTPKKFTQLKPDDIRGEFEEAGKTFIGRTASFSDDKWDKNYVYNSLRIQRKYWCELSEEDYQPLFDDLIHSVCGGKQENIDHLEQWVAYKYLFPERSVTTPSIEIVGQPGGNGKGILKNVLESVFIPMNVGSVTTKAIIGGFNSMMEGKVVVIVDDPQKDVNISDQFKESAGNKDGIIERKGVDAYQIDNTFNWLFTVNKPLSTLHGGGRSGEDRRISIFFTNIKLVSHLMGMYQCSETEAAQMADILNRFAMDRREVGKWLNHIINKHNVRNMQTLLALHGVDYHIRLEDQKDQYAEIFDDILPIFIKNGNLPHRFLKEIVCAKLNTDIKNTTSLINKFTEFLHREGVDIETVPTTTNILVKGSSVGKVKGKVKRVKGAGNDFNFDDISIGHFNEQNEIAHNEIRLIVPGVTMSGMDDVRDRLSRGFI